MAPTLSVVVPIYNVEEYLAECLESLAAQTLTDLEILLIDDGSPDRSAVIAKDFVDRDPRFRLIHQENQGLGPARNTGARHATGTYLAFADSDDVVPLPAYEHMVRTLEGSGSDLVTGAVDRFDEHGGARARFYGDAFRATRTRTHVTRDPELLHDRTAWNKVFRRAFWEAHRFAFPPGAYEDIPVIIPAHVRAARVDVLADVVYRYRTRASGADLSITQRRTEAGNFAARIASVVRVSEFLREHAPGLKDAYDLTTLAADLMIFINVVEDGDDRYREELCREVGGYVRRVNPELLTRLTSVQRLKYHLACEGRVADLVTVREYERTGLPALPPVARGALRRRWYAGHPFRDDAERPVPASVYDMTDELRLQSRVDSVTWDGDVLRLGGHAYVRGLPMALDDELEISLVHKVSGRRLHPEVRRVEAPHVTAATRQAAVSYDGSGFEAAVDVASLLDGSGTMTDWRVHAAVRVGRGFTRVREHGTIEGLGAHARWAPFHDLPDGSRLHVTRTGAGVTVQVRRPEAFVEEIVHDGPTVVLSGWLGGGAVRGGTARLHCPERSVRPSMPIVYGAESGGRVPFAVHIDLDDLLATGDDAPSRLRHDLSLASSGGRVRVSVPAGFRDRTILHGPRALLLTRTRYGNLTLLDTAPRVLITALRRDGDDLVVTGTPLGTARPAHLALHWREHAESRPLTPTWRDGAFTLRLRPGAMPIPGRPGGESGTLPLGAGRWDLVAEDADGGALGVVVARDCLSDLPTPHEDAGFRYEPRPARGDEGLCIVSRVAFALDEAGPYARRVLHESDYAAYRHRPVRDLVLFESYFGWQYSCNPKAIYEEFLRRDTGCELVWVTSERPYAPPDGCRTVRRMTREYYELTAAARFIVNNAAQPHTYRPRPGQLYVQTWHGTPIKSVGFDMLWSSMPRRDQRRRVLAEDVARWDLLISPNPFTTEVMRASFHYEGEILESGYPRNDRAFRPGADALRAQVRRALGIPDGKRAILYAPTWRDNLRTSGLSTARSDLPLDLEQASLALRDDAVLLLRPHHMLHVDVPPGLDGFVIDVGAHPDITELFLAADALVTDYSSAMCDFAGLGKPILLFTPDLDDYRDSIRGFALDLPKNPPGPLLHTSHDLIEALTSLDDVARASEPLLATFATRFAPHDDGHAGARVVDHLLNL
ncbi:bifunctional glycosyltransferase/CDP-glycerol:glycerophosphate glycerophosphotransferase [Actinomadura flavalba]|uniref:bifunctional glycosyltransferase/CDP-glycerol:glycerophosphate glycerophosphotransferase n=1 Tax=Actinomadura flavalba TaxID=1120938 RepID=UPI0003618DC0|nr:bifunctional glycosyltransferase/CDP-glycerol:glycerophosphate glycerophosphotransferase [Actinomadura flavalba]